MADTLADAQRASLSNSHDDHDRSFLGGDGAPHNGALHESDERYRQLLNNLPAAAYTCDAEGRITIFNQAAVDLWGRAPNLGEDLWCGSLRIYRTDGTPLPLDDCPMAIALKEGRGVRGHEVIIERPDGTRRNVIPYPEPLRNSAGQVIGASNMLVDVTESRRAEAAVAGQKRALEMAIHGATVESVLEILLQTIEAQSGHRVVASILLLDEDGKRLRHGAAPSLPEEYVRAIDGAEIGPAVGSCGTAAFTGNTVIVSDIATDPLWNNFKHLALKHGLRACWSTPIRSSQGTVLGTFALYYREVRDPSPADRITVDLLTHTAAIVVERQRAQEALHHSEARFRQMADNAPVMIWVTDPDGRCTFLSKSWYDFTGQTPETAVGFGWLDAIHPDDREMAQDGFITATDRPEPFRIDYRMRRKDGEYRWIIDAATPNRDPDGKLLGYIGSCIDITDRKQSEAALKLAKETAEAANAAKDRFLAVLSHELRTPLTPVLMAASAMESNMSLPQSVRQDIAMIRRNVELETKLIDDLLDLSRITSGKLRLQPQPIELNKAIEHVCEMCRTQLLEKAIHLHCSLGKDAGCVTADPARLQQVLWNVLKNAAKFTQDGGDIFVSTWRTARGRVRMEIRDTGIGIGPENLSRVFDAFEQGDSRITRQFGGLGLGLAISKAIVERHNGSIRAESGGVGCGSTFTIELPGALTAPSPLPQTPVDGDAQPRQLRVLIVEDHADTAQMLGRMLETWGYVVMTATSVSGALNLAAKQPFDVIVSDVGLPDATGYELMRQIRQRYAMKGIAMSGYGMDEDIRKGKEAGFSDHLVKPVDLIQLRQAIGRVAQHAD